MKKSLALLLAGVLACGLTACGTPAETPSEDPAEGEATGTYTVGICQLVQHEALDAATQGFKDALTEKLGEDGVKFEEGNASGESANCATIVNGFLSSDVDLILANATAPLQAAAAATDSIPVLGTSVTDYATALDRGLAWNEAGRHVALERSLLRSNDPTPMAQGDLSSPILRKDAVLLLDRLLPDGSLGRWEEGGRLTAKDSFPDWDSLTSPYQYALSRLFDASIVLGRLDGSFDGEAVIQRTDGAILLLRLVREVDRQLWGAETPVTLHIVSEAGEPLCPDQTVTARVGMITSDNPEVLAKVDWGTYAQAILGALLFVLAIVLAVEGCMTIFGKKNKK